MTEATPTTGPDDPTSAETTAGEDTTAGETSAPMVSYVADIQPIWDGEPGKSCVTGCHASDGIANYTTVILDSASSYDSMVDKPSPSVPSLKLVAPGDPDNSYLWLKLTGEFSDVGGIGTPMPQGYTLDQADLDLIEAWIVQGALP